MVSRVAPPIANSPWRIRHVRETGSTNADLLAAAEAGEPGGLVLVADHQTAGRGRLDRRWEAPAGANLLVSVLLRPAGPPETWFRATTAFAVAAADALQGIGADVGIKWPNDLVVDDEKLAGILAEARPDAGAVVVGMGCNVGWPTKGRLPGATSLASLGVDVSPALVLEWFLDAFDPASIDDPDLLERYRARCATTGRDVTVVLPDGTEVTGRAVRVDDDGLLVVEAPDPSGAATGGPAFVTRRFAVGDVVHARRH